MTITAVEAAKQANAKGATIAEIAAERRIQERQVGTVPFRNMIRALSMHPWLNSKEDWTRLAAALLARNAANRKAKA